MHFYLQWRMCFKQRMDEMKTAQNSFTTYENYWVPILIKTDLREKGKWVSLKYRWTVKICGGNTA